MEPAFSLSATRGGPKEAEEQPESEGTHLGIPYLQGFRMFTQPPTG
jgi:hypothetical protein